MAYTYTSYPCDGTVQVFAVPFPYLEREHVKVYLNGLLNEEWTWLTTSTIRMNSMPAAGLTLFLKRETPYAERAADFTDSSILDEETLDASQNELFYIMQEAVERTGTALSMDILADLWDLAGRRVTNVANPVDPQDAATKAYVDLMIPTAGAIEAKEEAIAAKGAALTAQATAEAARDATLAATEDLPELTEADQGKFLKVATPFTDGYVPEFIDLSSKENSLGNPDEDGKVLASTVGGARSWKSLMKQINPFFHAQHREAYNVAGGSMVGDAWTARVFNTVITNDIQGATLASPRVNLAAGRYRVDFAQTWVAPASATTFLGAVFVNGILQTDTLSPSDYQGSGYGNVVCRGGGEVVLSEAGYIEIRYYSGEARPTNGLGLRNSDGMLADTTIPSIYADLQIWQLDRSLEIAPVAINSGLQTVPGLDPHGDIDGFDIIRTGANQITVTKGECMDSTRLVPLALTADTPLALATTPNQIFHIYVVSLVAGGFAVKAYTTEAAVASDGTVLKWRWIGWTRNTGSGVLVIFIMIDGLMKFGKASENTFASNLTPTYTQYSHVAFLPENRIAGIVYGLRDGGGTQDVGMSSLDGVNMESCIGYGLNAANDTDAHAWGNYTYLNPTELPFTPLRYFKTAVNNGKLVISSVRVRR